MGYFYESLARDILKCLFDHQYIIDMDKEIVEDILWNLNYVTNSIETYGTEETFDVPFYINKLKKIIELMESQAS